ncbi:MAG: hypothetical protein JWN70_4867 [Planctomycetaceae bacterium]|nr:hypothetical protein [Planctomycetaceae bacterium]
MESGLFRRRKGMLPVNREATKQLPQDLWRSEDEWTSGLSLNVTNDRQDAYPTVLFLLLFLGHLQATAPEVEIVQGIGLLGLLKDFGRQPVDDEATVTVTFH